MRERRAAPLHRLSGVRLTLLAAGLFALAVAVLFALVVWSATHFMQRQIDATVANELIEVQSAGGTDAGGLVPVITRLVRQNPGMFYLLQNRSGQVLAGNLAAVRPRAGWHVISPDGRRDGRRGGGIRGRGVFLPDGGYLFVGLSDFQLDAMQGAVARSFLWGGAITLLLAVGGGLAVSLGLLRRVEQISRTARAIMAGDLSRRIPLRGRDDEFDHLAVSLNAMLDRIGVLMRGLQQVSDDIAHDLRTPLSRLRQRLELARGQGQVAGLQAAVEDSIADVDAILDSFAALLRIAQIEAGRRQAGFTRLDLGELLAGLAEDYRPVAEEAGQSLEMAASGPLLLNGDRALLTQGFANLIENAIRHTPPGTRITLAATGEASGIVASVADDGPGVPPGARDKVVQRFYRLESARHSPGSGLGLSLVDAIARLHGATLALEDNSPGLRCVMRFPA